MNMKALIVFYSRTGTTKKVAQAIHASLKCDIEEIVDKKSRIGVMGYLKGGRDALRKKPTKIGAPFKNPSKYDLIIIGTPVWAHNMTPAIRTYISHNKDDFQKIAFFCTMGGSGAASTFKEMMKLCEKKPLAILYLSTKEVLSTDYTSKIKEFLNNIKK